MSDFNSTDEDFVYCKIIFDAGGGSYGYTTARTESFEFGTKRELSEVITSEKTGNRVFTEEGRDGARNARKNGGIGRSKDSVRTCPSGGGDCGDGEAVKSGGGGGGTVASLVMVEVRVGRNVERETERKERRRKIRRFREISAISKEGKN
ncbi:hypothetical protein GQ457_02G009510 [Hibiscus cannabinus]